MILKRLFAKHPFEIAAVYAPKEGRCALGHPVLDAALAADRDSYHKLKRHIDCTPRGEILDQQKALRHPLIETALQLPAEELGRVIWAGLLGRFAEHDYVQNGDGLFPENLRIFLDRLIHFDRHEKSARLSGSDVQRIFRDHGEAIFNAEAVREYRIRVLSDLLPRRVFGDYPASARSAVLDALSDPRAKIDGTKLFGLVGLCRWAGVDLDDCPMYGQLSRTELGARAEDEAFVRGLQPLSQAALAGTPITPEAIRSLSEEERARLFLDVRAADIQNDAWKSQRSLFDRWTPSTARLRALILAYVPTPDWYAEYENPDPDGEGPPSDVALVQVLTVLPMRFPDDVFERALSLFAEEAHRRTDTSLPSALRVAADKMTPGQIELFKQRGDMFPPATFEAVLRYMGLLPPLETPDLDRVLKEAYRQILDIQGQDAERGPKSRYH